MIIVSHEPDPTCLCRSCRAYGKEQQETQFYCRLASHIDNINILELWAYRQNKRSIKVNPNYGKTESINPQSDSLK